MHARTSRQALWLVVSKHRRQRRADIYLQGFKGKINVHKDMNPNMVVNAETNSQIIGTSVIVVTFYLGQLFKLCRALGKKKYETVGEFLTHHGSVYVLHPHDDLEYYHTVSFSGQSENETNSSGYTGVRVALTFRWLGNRTLYFGNDYKVKLQRNCQVVEKPILELRKKHPKRPDIAALFEECLS